MKKASSSLSAVWLFLLIHSILNRIAVHVYGHEGLYSKARIVDGIHLRSGPIFRRCVKILYPNEYKIDAICDPNKEERKLVELWARTQFEVIIDDTPQLPKNKWSFTTELGFSPVAWCNTSFMLQWHYGRDYLNIRYDTVVNNILLVAVFNFNKYRPSYVSTKA